MINEWPVAFPVTFQYSVRLAGVAPDKENISCEYLCSLFKAKAQCLHKVIRLYTCTERHTSAERGRKKRETCEHQAALTSITCPLPFFLLLQPIPPLPHINSFLLLLCLR